ncbi:hypothetical protein FDECE_4082 [Fusarium decemcellulare]|nr:hypothetical protein FDECE_4082 [Fusarium decemcellulare]
MSSPSATTVEQQDAQGDLHVGESHEQETGAARESSDSLGADKAGSSIDDHDDKAAIITQLRQELERVRNEKSDGEIVAREAYESLLQVEKGFNIISETIGRMEKDSPKIKECARQRDEYGSALVKIDEALARLCRDMKSDYLELQNIRKKCEEVRDAEDVLPDAEAFELKYNKVCELFEAQYDILERAFGRVQGPFEP